jgi:hypothetical protein
MVTDIPASTVASPRGAREVRPTPRYGLWAFVAVCVLAVLYLVTSARIESYGSDTSTYFGLAQSLRHQHAYWFDFAPHVTYPPGYPVLLAGLMSVVGENFAALVRLSIPIFFLGLFGLYRLLELQWGSRIASALVILAAVSGDAYFWSTVGLHSDVPYFTVSIFALLCFVLGERASTRGRRIAYRILVAVLASYLVLLRSVGVTLVGGILLWMVYPVIPLWRTAGDSSLGRVRRWLPPSLLPLIVLVAWSAWTRQHAPPRTAGGDYMDSYGQQFLKEDPHQIDSPMISVVKIPARVLRMAGTRATNAVHMVLNTPPVYLSAYNPLVLAFVLIVIVGFVSVARHGGGGKGRGGTIVECYMLSYCALLVLYPFDEGSRYLLPILPFLGLYGLEGIKAFSRLFRRVGRSTRGRFVVALGSDRLLAASLGVLFALITLGGLVRINGLAHINLHPDPSSFTNAATQRASEWVARNTRPGDVIMNDQWAILHRLTNRKTVRFPLTTDPTVIAQRIASDDVAYVVVLNEKRYEYYNPSMMRRFDVVRKQHASWFAPAHVFQDGTIYCVQRGEIPAIASGAHGDLVHAVVSTTSLDPAMGPTAGEKR